MYKSRFRLWAIFTAWVAGAVLCGLLDRGRTYEVFLTVYMVSSVVAILMATRKHRPPNYKFQFVRPGVVRSPLGFEVRSSNSRLEYVEGDHVISWQASPAGPAVGRFQLSESGISGWDSPFDSESINSAKKREVFRAMVSALSYMQLVLLR
jgi:hypothetical protein